MTVLLRSARDAVWYGALAVANLALFQALHPKDSRVFSLLIAAAWAAAAFYSFELRQWSVLALAGSNALLSGVYFVKVRWELCGVCVANRRPVGSRTSRKASRWRSARCRCEAGAWVRIQRSQLSGACCRLNTNE